ncbi:MAG: hypothetical protein ACKVOB_13280 [Sphingomonas sp.]
MADLCQPARDSVAAQSELFRRAQCECGLDLRVIAAASPIPFSTLKGWKDGSAMPAWAIGALGAAGVPDHLLSLITAPWQRSIVTDETGDGDLDTAAIEASDFAASVARARSPLSPGGVAIVPQEVAVIQPKRQRALSAMQRARAA